MEKWKSLIFILLKALYNLTFLILLKGWTKPKKMVDKKVYNLWKSGKVKKFLFKILYIYKI